jgi:hypothetical protein
MGSALLTTLPAADPASLSQAAAAVRQAERSAGREDVTEELRLARKGLERAAEAVGRGDPQAARQEVEAARGMLRHVLEHPRGEQPATLDGVRSALDTLDRAFPEAGSMSAATETGWGLKTTTFSSAQGTVTVYLPADVRAGDTISGAVVAEPAGDTPEERARNRDRLDGYVVAVAGQETEVSSARGRWLVPATATAFAVALTDPSGRTVELEPTPLQSADAVTPPGFEIAPIGQVGRPVPIVGPFDGDLAGTSVSIGGRPAELLAESPRGLFARCPDLVGTQPVTVEEGGAQVASREDFRNLGISLHVDQRTLQSGQRTQLEVRVEGLEGLDEPVELRVVNSSPAVVTLEGGEQQSVTIDPEQVTADGWYELDRPVTGVQPGPFTINASITLAGEDCCKDCHAECEKKHVKCVEGTTRDSIRDRQSMGWVRKGEVECVRATVATETCAGEHCSAWCPGAWPTEWLLWQYCCRYSIWAETSSKVVLKAVEKGKDDKPSQGAEMRANYDDCCALLWITQICGIATMPFGSESVTYDDLFDRVGAKGLKEAEATAKRCGLENEWAGCLKKAGATGAFKKALDALEEGTKPK